MIGYKSYCRMTTSEATEAFGQLQNYGITDPPLLDVDHSLETQKH